MKLVPASVTRGLARKVLQTKKNSPHIFFGLGVVGSVGSTVLACKATLKLEPVVDEIRADLVEVKQLGHPSETAVGGEVYPDRQYYRDLGYVYFKSAKKIGRLYGPSAILGVASIGALTGSHIQLTRRNTALTATLALISQAFDDYRGRVRNEIGDERELDIYRGIDEHTVKIDGKNKIVRAVDPLKMSIYARCFDETNPNFKNDAELNRMFISCQERYANHLLYARGHVLLNDVYDALGFERTAPGCIMGWTLDGEGDDHIDFGLFEERSILFLNGDEKTVWLDFNVDGVIWEKI